ncbi:MAG: DUF433 domain-containing protein [Candidatus Baldrarchaeia archaeon]
MNENNDLLKRIVCDPKILKGKPIIKGTRISVDIILDYLASGMSIEKIAEELKLDVDDVKAAIFYAKMKVMASVVR